MLTDHSSWPKLISGVAIQAADNDLSLSVLFVVTYDVSLINEV